ncbi:CHASE2 and HATPase_c domain-containing protein [Cupriavidus sp. WKF15]|uniref:CHASE2 and HATPase_c domain-containing protein n=1 Tax=Cupriavidus sp. WKF15 TaxID=3032282 RepID=UPI0023E182EA|nr:CHASE2 and HATPase_c domain-containing protein [Cupriavidus sp. WKF15]WER49216.1 CHASE2 and HATPase_c domain-containing protein [Cupriavidus sp. WKF15]
MATASASGRPGRQAPGIAFGRRTLAEWALLLAAVLALVAAIARYGWAGRADLAIYDLSIGAQQHAASDDIVIVAIDDASITAIGRWPWRRAVLAQLVDRIAAGQPRVIGVDVILTERDTRYPQDDALLARSLAAAGNVVLPALAEPSAGGMVVRYPLAGLGAGVGHINLTVDADGVARQVYLLEGPQPAQYAGLPHVAAVMASWGGAPRPADAYRHEAASAVDAFGWERQYRLRIPFAGPPGTFARVSARDVLEGRADPALFRGKAVLFGAIATGMGDVLPTPVAHDGRGMSGVEILANTLQTLQEDRAIVAVPPGWQLACAMLAVLAAALAALVLTPRGALLASGMVIALLLAGPPLLLAGARLWFAPSAALLGCLLFYPLWSWRRQEAALRFLADELARHEREPGLPPAPAAIGATLESHMRAVYRMSSRLHDLRRFLADGLESLPEATAICNLEGGVLLANRRCVALVPGVLGTSAGSGGDMSDARADSARADIRAVMAVLFAAPEPALAYWQALHARSASPGGQDDGIELAARDERRYLMHGAPLHGEQGAVAGLIVSFIDITAIRLAERQREQMLRFLSHDMRSPQASILALIDLHRGAAGDERSADLLARIDSHARRTLSLADDFIRVARAETQPLSLQDADLAGLVLDAADELWALASARGVPLNVDLPDDPAVIRAEPALLARAIANLVSNAVKFSPRGAAVTVTLRAEPGGYAIAVTDQGPGIPLAQQQRLFEPFARLHEHDPGAPAGSGLGLVLAKTVVERHGGSIRVASDAGAGATFTLHLPAPRL